MATQKNCTNTIQGTLNWLYAFVLGRTTIGVGGFTGEPALTSANYIIQMMLAPPFAWSWNRQLTKAFTMTVGKTDYAVAVPDFGWAEKATVTDNSAPAGTPPTFELEVSNVLAQESLMGRPMHIAPLYEDNQSNMIFRVSPAPDKAYNCQIMYQKAPVLLSTITNSTWAPIPDKFAFVYERGLLAMLRMMYDNQEATNDFVIFLHSLVSVSEGLNEQEKAIFVEDSLRLLRTQQAEIAGVSQGKQIRV